MKKILKYGIGITIIIIVVLVITLFNLKKELNNIENITETEINQENIQTVGTKKIEKVTNRDDFYIVENCIKKYMEYVQNEDIDKIYGCLDEDYITNEKITRNNINEKIKNLKLGEFRARKMYEYDDTETVSGYFVQGILQKEEYYIIVNIDYANETFSVLPGYYFKESSMQNSNKVEMIKIQ